MNSLYPSVEDLQFRWKKVQEFLKEIKADACLVATNANLYYLAGRVFGGYFYLPAEGEPVCFARRPESIPGIHVVAIRKPEDIPSLLSDQQLTLPVVLGLEADQVTYSEYTRLQSVFNPKSAINISDNLRRARMLKTSWEVDQFRVSAQKHAGVYQRIPSCYRKGMTDLELQFRIEQEMRSTGSIGIFRSFGSNMDIYMGSLLAGDNAEIPSPFDYALGGQGAHPSLPIGANGTRLNPGTAVMVDMAGNYTAYITDMTRTFSIGRLPEKAYRAHQVSIEMNNRLMETGKEGTSCADIYEWSMEMAAEAGLADNFMGTKSQAKFVGHGVGIEINELPIFMKRSKDHLQPGMVFAYEPKFVLPEIGAVGIENTYLVTASGIEKLTVFEEAIIEL